jgi:hypothetical protein
MDVLSASYGDNKIAWYENTDGKGGFGEPQIISNSAKWAGSVHAADLDGDGDMDVLSASADDDKIAWYENRLVGDANDDGVFNSSDLVQVFQAGEYEDDILHNSTYGEGDWNRDGEFDSADLVHAFQAGIYEKRTAPCFPDVAAAVDVVFAELDAHSRRPAYIA